MKVAEIAARLGGLTEGDGACEISGVAALQDATAGDLSFVADKRFASVANVTAASAVLAPRDWDLPCPAIIIRLDDPDAAFQQAVAWFAPPAVQFEPGIHSTAVVAEDAVLGPDAHVGPYCVIQSGAVIGANAVMVANCYVGHQVTIGNNCLLYPQVTVREYVRLGNRVIAHSGAVIGSDGFGYTVNGHGEGTKIPQLGIVTIGDDVEIGANTTIDRARFSATHIGNGSKIDNLVQIGHNAVIGENVGIISQAGISGSTRIESEVTIFGQAGLVGHIEIGRGATVGAQAGVTRSVPPGEYVSGYPAAPHAKATKLQAHVGKLPELKKKVKQLEARIKMLESSAKKQ